jgi:dihydroorotate dehydrogenase electron transfer subunit
MDDIEGKITVNRTVTPGYHLLKVRLSRSMDVPKPGQFVMIRIPGNEVFLRRPFGIYHYEKKMLTIMYKVVGKGTDRLAKTLKDEIVFVLGPLGKGFHIPEKGKYIVVAGGIGIAGVHSLVERLDEGASLFYGCSTKEEVNLINDLAHLNPAVSTMDGSYGFKGDVVTLLRKHLKLKANKGAQIFACGPDAMLKSLKKVLEKEPFPCQALVEERMACGLGLCFGCVKKTVDENEPYKRVCKEGPVFDLWEICL